MASNGAGEPLLSSSIEPKHQINKPSAPKRRRFRRCKSAPLADFITPDLTKPEKFPRADTIFGPLHPNVKKVAVYLAVYLSIGTISFYMVQRQIDGKKTDAIVDSLYFCIVTMTTVGYGDLVPDSTPSKLLACAFVFAGMALGGLILSKGADYLVEKQEILLAKALHMNHKLDPSDMMKEIETNKVKYKMLVISIVLGVGYVVGIIFLIFFEEMTFIDAFYCVCATITTLGYGDQSFHTTFGRLFAVVWILTSTVSLGQFFLYIAELNTENRQRELVKWVLTRKMTQVDLEAADIDADGVVG